MFPCKYTFLEFKITLAVLMPICCICYTDALKYLASGWLIGHVYWVAGSNTEGSWVEFFSLLQNIHTVSDTALPPFKLVKNTFSGGKVDGT